MAQNQAEPKKEVEFNEFYTEVSKTVVARCPLHLFTIPKKPLFRLRKLKNEIQF